MGFAETKLNRATMHLGMQGRKPLILLGFTATIHLDMQGCIGLCSFLRKQLTGYAHCYPRKKQCKSKCRGNVQTISASDMHSGSSSLRPHVKNSVWVFPQKKEAT